MYYFEKDLLISQNRPLTGQVIGKLHNMVGLNQHEFAARLGISQSYLSAIKSGNRTLKMENLIAVCNELNVLGANVTPETLISGELDTYHRIQAVLKYAPTLSRLEEILQEHQSYEMMSGKLNQVFSH